MVHLRRHIQTQERHCVLNLSKRVVQYSYSNASWTLGYDKGNLDSRGEEIIQGGTIDNY